MKKKKSKGAKKINYQKKIVEYLKKRAPKKVKYKTLLKDMRGKQFDFVEFTKALEKLKKENVIVEDQKGISLAGEKKTVVGKIVKLGKTFGFARLEDTDEEIFIAGRNLSGALPGDKVKLRTFKSSSGDSPEGEVVEIVEENFSLFTGVIIGENFSLLIPDMFPQYEMIFENPLGYNLSSGDKVIAKIIKRGKRHSEHRCEIVSNLGSSQKAAVCAEGILAVNGINAEFSGEVLKNADEVSDYNEISREIKNRLDLREEKIFTIDSAHTKDIDDAISVERTENGYKLGVHIADVSHYVKPKSELDNEAFNRGTSVYYANKVVPMLPKVLSNGICSLNEGEDRLAFSCLMEIDNGGRLLSYDFKKTVIRSKVKGVYSEINELLSGSEASDLRDKYKEVSGCFEVMRELALKLRKNRLERGAPQIESTEGAVVIDENDICVGVLPHERGESEEIIEDFMLMANESAARFARDNELPFVYRVHEKPDGEKISTLGEILSLLNIPHNFENGVSPKDLSKVLKYVKGKPSAVAINSLVLRSMSKAKYSEEELGHFGLALDNYAHFTSPIRRYPDLAVHRIMSDYLETKDSGLTRARFNKFVYAASSRSSEAEIRALSVERSCDDCYKAEYLSTMTGEQADGVICSVMDFGFFVTLDNTCEGLVRTKSLDGEEYYVDNLLTLKSKTSGDSYSVGERVTVKIESCNISEGNVDFSFVKKIED
ncbi:MAG: ribonuclease R [Ruminococcus sp.]|nr:ribonuclease R [Ruminococcus sp.]